MCRITATLSSRPASSRDLLYGNAKSLLAQADAVKGRFQDDGWGIGFFRARTPVVIKSPEAARLEKPAFEAAADKAVSRVVVAHLRDASNPSGLPKASLISRNNTQPFSAGGLVFAHNGTLFIKDEIRALLGKYASKVKGANDSEVLFWQVMKMLDACGSPEAARLEKPAFEAAADKAVSRVVVAHLRDASNPSGLPKASLISRNNTQPFSAGGLVFAHNGTLFIKDEIRALLGKYASKVKGANDSEVLFWQVMKMLDACGSPEAALRLALDEIRTVWRSAKKSRPELKAPYRGLNLFLASADSLTVLCHYQIKKEGGKGALLTPGWEFGRIAWRQEKDSVVFSSEPADAGKGWKKMNDQQVASATVRGGKLRLGFKRITL